MEVKKFLRLLRRYLALIALLRDFVVSLNDFFQSDDFDGDDDDERDVEPALESKDLL